MENYKYLGEIRGIYNSLNNVNNYEDLIKLTDANIREKIINNTEDEFNIYSKLLIYANDNQGTLKLAYINEYYDSYADCVNYTNKSEDKLNLANVEEGQIILNNMGYIEYTLMINNFNKDLIKQVLFSKFLGYLGDELNYIYIY